jgi:hypothetical protein
VVRLHSVRNLEQSFHRSIKISERPFFFVFHRARAALAS